MSVSDYSTTPDQNTTISGINIAEGCPPSGINNAIRQLMADIKSKDDAQDSSISDAASAADSKLPKSGGTMTGSIATQSEAIVGKTDTSFVRINGGASYGNGSWILLTGKDFANYNGRWIVSAKSSSQQCDLRGYPDGKLDWGGHDVLTANGFTMENGSTINMESKTSNLNLHGGQSSQDGAGLWLYGGSNQNDAGSFRLRAANGTYKDLVGKNTGELTWGGKDVITGDGGTLSDAVKINCGSASSYSYFGGGPQNQQSAGLWLTGGSSSDNGIFRLRAGTYGNNTFKDLVGKADGTLSWNGNSILRVGNISSYISFKTVAAGSTLTIPSGGTWSWCWWSVGGTNSGASSQSGGSSWRNTSSVTVVGFCIRTA